MSEVLGTGAYGDPENPTLSRGEYDALQAPAPEKPKADKPKVDDEPKDQASE